MYFIHLLDGVKGINQYQFVQNELNRITLNIDAASGFAPGLQASLCHQGQAELMLHKIRKFTKLKSRQRWLFIEAYARLGVMRAAILTLPFKKLVKSLDHQKGALAPPLKRVQMETALAIGEVVRTAAGNTPWESACLAQTLTAQRMLDNRGIGGIFHLGATMDETAGEKLKAHAWLLCDNTIITGEAGHEQYAVLSTFSWKGE